MKVYLAPRFGPQGRSQDISWFEVGGISSTKQIFQLARPTLHSGGCLSFFHQFWAQKFPYAFPPFCLISRVLRRAQSQKINNMVLVAPLWPTQHWYPLLRSMVVAVAVILPQYHKLLSNPKGQIHPLLETSSLALVAFLVSGIEFRKELCPNTLSHGT